MLERVTDADNLAIAETLSPELAGDLTKGWVQQTLQEHTLAGNTDIGGSEQMGRSIHCRAP